MCHEIIFRKKDNSMRKVIVFKHKPVFYIFDFGLKVPVRISTGDTEGYVTIAYETLKPFTYEWPTHTCKWAALEDLHNCLKIIFSAIHITDDRSEQNPDEILASLE
jgi:hypothetical protein